MATSNAGSIRAMNRERITEAILACAREQIAASGAAGLSLRAIAREMGMASSAIYRYFPGRDELLTKLIIDSYDALGDYVERAEGCVHRRDLPGRFRAICSAARRWALENPQQFFLIYGTPVPGYAAPVDTVAPATRVSTLMLALLVDAALAGSTGATDQWPLVDDRLRSAIAPIRIMAPPQIPDAQLIRGLGTFSGLLGAITVELGGQLHNVIGESEADRGAYFESLVDGWVGTIELRPLD